jgi:hypothetical protein
MRACALGRLSFAYFSVAADRKVSRHKGEITELKKTEKHQINKTTSTGTQKTQISV